MASRRFIHIFVFRLLITIVTVLTSLPCHAARHFTVADDIGLSHFGDPNSLDEPAFVFSPNRKYFVVHAERGRLDLNQPEATIRVYRSEDVRQFLLHPEIAGEPTPAWEFSRSTHRNGPIITNIRWLADSSGFAFLTKTADGKNQLFLAKIQALTVSALTPENQHVTAFDIRSENSLVYTVLSPVAWERAHAQSRATSIVGTGRGLYSLIFPEDKFPAHLLIHDLSELWAVVDGKRFRIEDRESGRQVPSYSSGQLALALSPDGKTVITALALSTVPPEWEKLYPAPKPSDPYQIRAGHQDLESVDGFRSVSHYVLIELSTGVTRQLTDGPLAGDADWFSIPSAGWSADGKSVVLSGAFLPAHGQTGLQENQPCIVVVDVAAGRSICLERVYGETKDDFAENDDWHYITKVRFASGSSRRVVVDHLLLGDKRRSVSYVRADDESWTKVESRQATEEDTLGVSIRQGLNEPPLLVATDRQSKATRVIWNPNPQLSEIALGKVSVDKWKDKAGQEQVGGLYLPPEYVRGQRYPLVIQNHGFDESEFAPSGAFPTAFAAQELAAAGIVVLQVRGANCSTGTPGEAPCNVAGYEAAIGKLVADGVVDPERLGIIGFSRTCYYVLEALTASSLHFKAASITDGVNVGYLQYLTGVDSGGNAVAHEFDAMIGAQPFGDGLQQWLKRSPEFNMTKITTPLQVVALDPSSVLDMWEPYAALRYLGKPVDLIVLGDGTHVLTNPSGRMVSQGGTVDWFRFWLTGQEDADPAKKEQYVRWHELRKLQQQNSTKPQAGSSPVN